MAAAGGATSLPPSPFAPGGAIARDPFCAAASARQTPPPPRRRVAVVLRGEGFRNWHWRGMNTTCCNGSLPVQREIARSHRALFGALERAGLEVDVFVATYRCTNGADLVGRHLKRWYARWLRGLTIADRAARGASLSLALV